MPLIKTLFDPKIKSKKTRASFTLRLILFLSLEFLLVMSAFSFFTLASLKKLGMEILKDNEEKSTILAEQTKESLIKEGAKYTKTLVENFSREIRSSFTEMEKVVKIVSQRLEEISTYKSTPSSHPPLYSASDYDDPAKAPPDLIYDAKRRKMVSYGNFVFKNAPDITLKRAANDALTFYPLLPLFSKLIEIYPECEWVYLGLHSGTFISYPGDGGYDPSYDPRSRDWFISAVKSGGITWSKPYTDAAGTGLTITCSSPVFNPIDGKLIGVAGVDIALRKILTWISEFYEKGKGDSLIIDKDGDIIVQWRYKEEGSNWNEGFRIENIFSNPESGLYEVGLKVLKERVGGCTEMIDGKEKFVAYAPIETPDWILIVIFPMEEISRLYNEQRMRIQKGFSILDESINRIVSSYRNIFPLWIVLVIAVTSIFVAFTIHIKLTIPIKRFIDDIKVISSGDLSHKVVYKTVDEIGSLAESFNFMTENLKRSRDEIEAYSKNLEKLVQERTRRLTKQNEELLRLYEEVDRAYRELKNTQTQLIQQEKMASLGQVVAGIAHEINNPINFMVNSIRPLRLLLGKLGIILKQYDELHRFDSREIEEKLKEIDVLKEEMNYSKILSEIGSALDLIRDGAERTLGIVQSLRNYSRMDGDVLREVDIHDNIEMTLRLLTNLYKNRITIHKDFRIKGPILCYPGLLNQVFMNLITNAIDSIPGEGEIHIETEETDDSYIIRFSDTGVGIPSENMERIFEPFFTTKDSKRGTGLGLSITRRIVEEKHKGRIEVKSKVGEGSEFTVILPKIIDENV